jgi:hypothetical protein
VLIRSVRALMLVAIASLVFASPAFAASRAAVTIDFSTYPTGQWLPGSALSAKGFIFPAQQCGPIGCHDWWVGGDMYDPGLQGSAYEGPISFRVLAPASSIAIEVMAEVQYKGVFTISAFDVKGKLVGRRTVIRQQDQGLPGFQGFGYFPMSMGLLRDACSFTISSKWLAGSGYQYLDAPFAVNFVKIHHQQSPSKGCHR